MDSQILGSQDPYFIWFLISLFLLPIFYIVAYVLFLMMLENLKSFKAKSKFVQRLLSVLLFSPILIVIVVSLYFTGFIHSIFGNSSPYLLQGLILVQSDILVVGSTIVYFKTRQANKLSHYLAILALTIPPTAVYFVLQWLELLRNS